MKTYKKNQKTQRPTVEEHFLEHNRETTSSYLMISGRSFMGGSMEKQIERYYVMVVNTFLDGCKKTLKIRWLDCPDY